MIGKGSV